MKNLSFLAARSLLAVSLAFTPVMHSAQAGIPVIDASVLSQTIISALEEVAQTIKQIEQYKTQLQQYENMIKNTLAPAAYIWSRVQGTIESVKGLISDLEYYKNRAGNLSAYLDQYQTVGFYNGSPCFSAGGCSAAEAKKLEEARMRASEARKIANDSVFTGMDRQLETLKSDVSNLSNLQTHAEGATGQMEALGFANQIAAATTNQLLQIRAVLISSQNALITEKQVQLDREAQEEASAAQLRRGKFVASPKVLW